MSRDINFLARTSTGPQADSEPAAHMDHFLVWPDALCWEMLSPEAVHNL